MARRVSATPVSRLAATVERLRREIQEANAAADGRALVELAKGVLVERLRCGPAQAARQLETLAEQASVTPLELAADLVNQAAQDRVTEAVGEFLVRTTDKLSAVRQGTTDKLSAVVRLRTAESAVLAGGDTQRVAESVLAHAAGPLGATAVAIWSAATDSSLTLAGFAGIGAAEASRWRYVPPGVATPARRALIEREPVWIEDLAGAGLPSVGPSGGRAVLPTVTGGRLLGVLEVCWPRPLEPQPQSVHRQLDALAELCGHALDADALAAAGARPDHSELASLADGLFDSALVLRPHLDDTGALVDFRIAHLNPAFVDLTGRPRGLVSGALLLEAYPMAGAGHLFEKVEHVYATGETFRTDRMTFTELVDQVPLTVIAALSISRHGDAVLVVWRVEDETARLATLLQHAQRLGRVGGFEESTVTGDITWSGQLYALYGLAPGEDPVPLARLADHAHEDDVPAIDRFLRAVLRYKRAGSASFRLLRSDGVARHIRVVAEPVLDPAGHLLAVRGAFQDISAQHWTEVALSATRDRLADTEQHVAEQQRLTVQLQQAIMPAAEPSIEAFGLRIAVRYRPSGGVHVVGGDWYDAVVLPSKQILVSVGDITGHGIKAATGMVVLRNALRGLAATGAGPGQMLTWLNLVAHHLTDHILATAVCGLYDPETRVLRWARAGHPAPVLVRSGRATALPLLSGVLLGALAEGTYEQGEVQLEPGDTLLLYTDGLIERRDVPLDECLERLLEVSARFEGSLEDRLDDLLDGSDSNTDDDTCVVGLLVT
ncbi:MAG: SpoIIE family protein phosphatase [Saccharothrix sp.]|nr:SpoIIE family protein phosphatase [Saccharothrix sp.]